MLTTISSSHTHTAPVDKASQASQACRCDVACRNVSPAKDCIVCFKPFHLRHHHCVYRPGRNSWEDPICTEGCSCRESLCNSCAVRYPKCVYNTKQQRRIDLLKDILVKRNLWRGVVGSAVCAEPMLGSAIARYRLELMIEKRTGCLTKKCYVCYGTFVCLPLTPGVSRWKCNECYEGWPR